MKRYLPLITAVVIYVAFILIVLGYGLFRPIQLLLFPLAILGFLIPVWFFVHLLISLFIKPWREEELNWIIISIDIVLAGVLAIIQMLSWK